MSHEEVAPVQAPTDIAGVGIHLQYIRRDMSEITKKLDSMGNNFVPLTLFMDLKVDLTEYQKKVDILTKINDTFTGKVWGIGATMTIVISIITYAINLIVK